MPQGERQRRIRILAVFGLLLAALLVWRVLAVSLVLGPPLVQLGDQFRIRTMPVAAPRGAIYSRSGKLLVTSEPSFAAYYFRVGGPPSLGEQKTLEADLGITPQAMTKALFIFSTEPSLPVVLKSGLSPSELTQLLQGLPELPGVFVNPQPVRNDLLGSVGGQMIGYVSRVTAPELAAWKLPGLTAASVVGQTGLELAYQNQLFGRPGGEKVEVNANGLPVKVLGTTPPVPGDSLTLTISKTLEQISAKALLADMAMLRKQYGSQSAVLSGAVVVVDIHTGAVLSMVSEPSYNPNAFAQGISTAAYQALAQNPGLPFLNRAVQTASPPGSVFKMVTAMAGLTAGKITPTSTITCLPRYWRPPYPYNWLRRTSTGPNTLVKAIAQSCDTYFYAVGHRVGINAIADWAHKFGFGHPTGVDLPGEVAGVIPTVAYYEKQYGSLYPGLAYSVAIGQGADEVTLMQLAQYIGALATDGTMVKPYLVQQIKSPSGKVLFNATPQIVGHISAPLAYWSVIRQGMIDVTTPGSIPGPGGTAGGAFVNFPMQVAAKTGTAQLPGGVKGGQGYMTFFISYAPANNPQIAVVSTMQTVSMVAGGMIARAIYDAYFHLHDPNPPFPQVVTPTTPPTTPAQTAATAAP